jgi:hypothetical protein
MLEAVGAHPLDRLDESLAPHVIAELVEGLGG